MRQSATRTYFEVDKRVQTHYTVTNFKRGYDSMRLTKEIVIAKCNSFVDFQIWPLTQQLDVSGWLSNFYKDEVEHATTLLNSFTYYSEPIVNKMLQSSFDNLLSKQFGMLGQEGISGTTRFLDRMCINHVTGENPNATDSGHVFARKARQVLGVRENQILYPEIAIQKLCCNEYDNVIFVDDFLGSGEQIFATMHRPYMRELELTFSSFGLGKGVQLFYIPLLASEFGLKRTADLCPNLTVIPANVLPKRFSVFDPETVVWPPELKSEADSFIRNASRRAGYGDGFGMAGLGYQVAFYHSTPDATLPIFWSDRNGWKPLVRRL